MVEFSELLFSYGFIIASLIVAILGAILTKRFKGSTQFIPWLLITIAFSMDFIANIFWLNYTYSYGSLADIPYPTFLDVMWLVYYTLIGVGFILYWTHITKSVKEKIDYKPVIAVIVTTLIAFFSGIAFYQTTELYTDLIFDSLYIALPVFVSASSVILIILFKGGKLSKSWSYILMGGLTYAIAETFYMIELVTTANFGTPNFLYIAGYVMFIIGLTRIIYE